MMKILLDNQASLNDIDKMKVGHVTGVIRLPAIYLLEGRLILMQPTFT